MPPIWHSFICLSPFYDLFSFFFFFFTFHYLSFPLKVPTKWNYPWPYLNVYGLKHKFSRQVKKIYSTFFLVEILTKSDRRTFDRFLSFLISNCSRINPRKKEKTGAQFKIHFRRFFIVLWQKAVWDLKLEGKLFWNPKNVPLHLAWTGDLIDHRCFISLVAI